jgi:hypothetical protein
VASLLLRSVTKVLTINPGFNANGVLAVQLQTVKPPDVDLAAARLLADQLRRIPSVQAVADATYLKFVPRQSLQVIGYSTDSTLLQMVAYQIASPEYFTTLGIPFLAGHTFPADPDGASTCVVNQALARAAWPGQDPLGQIVDPGLGQCTVVGVVGNTRERIETEPGPEIYYADSSRQGSVDCLLIRLSSDLPSVRSTILASIKSIDPHRRVESTEFVTDVLFTNIPTPPFYAMVFGWFGGLALILAAVGVHGMMGQVVARRWNEIGVRLTVGARPVDVWLMMVLFVAKLLLSGVAIGLVAAVWMARSMGSMLFDLAPSDPATLAGATLVVLVVGLGAAIVPSLRASRIDPTILLRSE